MVRTSTYLEWLALSAFAGFIPAPAEGKAGSPYSPDGLPFSSALLASENRLLDPGAVSNASAVDLKGLHFGGLRMDFEVRKAGAAPDRLPYLRYTSAVAQRQWLRSITAPGPRKLAFSGAFESGFSRGLSFSMERQKNDGRSFSDTSLAFSRNGLDASLRMRDVSQGLSRSALMSEKEWNDVKGLLGWKQTDMAFSWKGTPGLSVSAATSRARNDSDGASRSSRAVDLAWKPSSRTDFAWHSDMALTGNRAGSTRTGTQRLSLKHNQDGFGFDVSQEILENVKGRSGRSRSLAFSSPADASAVFKAEFAESRINDKSSSLQKYSIQTREKAPLWLGLTSTRSRDGDVDKTVNALQFRAAPGGGLSLNGGMALTSGTAGRTNQADVKLGWKTGERFSLNGGMTLVNGAAGRSSQADVKLGWEPNARLNLDASHSAGRAKGERKTDSSLSLDYKPGGDWRLAANWKDAAGAARAMADVKLTGHLDRNNLVDAQLLRPVDPKNPYRRQDTVKIERPLAPDTVLTADYSALETVAGASAQVASLRLNAKLPFAQVSAGHRSGGKGLVPDQTEFTFAGADGKDSPLKLNARYRRTDGAPTTRALTASWQVRKGLSLDGTFADNPENDKGQVQDLSVRSVAMHLDVAPGLKLDLSHARESRRDADSTRTDLALKGRLNRLTEVDLGFTTRDVKDLPNDPSYRLTVRHEVDKDHRVLVQLDRKTRAVHGKDDLTARLEVLADF